MTDETAWLKSPLAERAERLQPMSELWLRPYHGKKRKVKVFRSEITVGNSEACDIRIDDPYVSPLHAEFRLENGGEGYSVRDLTSRNGVFLNGVRVKWAPLPVTGVLRMGRSMLTWSNQEPESEILEEGWVVADPAMRELVESVRTIAKSPLPVLLLGETGTGKDVLARMIHHWGPRASGPFVPVNGALTGGTLAESELFGHKKGAFTGAEAARLGALRSAHGGTLFLDEVADVPVSTQVKLLRALESGEVKALGADRAEGSAFRLVTATSRNLERMTRDGSFRNDLYFRIAGFVVHVPPLRDRPQDILAISAKLAHERGLLFSPEAQKRLLHYPWPGNVRELRACIERAAVAAQASGTLMVQLEHLAGMSQGLSAARGNGECVPRTLQAIERECIEAALARNVWSKKAAALELGIARSTLWEKMKRLGLSAATEA